ncbi:8190_t:CDS:2 [Gigaspora margarita]|uniref:8190_t:CDS:1 n=1 Tax=Gigaspora margarita TaxID=4874 RepID=A0ABN7UU42_GIGMA|nr:8190_t:CDS:2 [Gigaspora margarita]
MQTNNLTTGTLPPGNRAHEMPLAVSDWINDLEIAQQNIMDGNLDTPAFNICSLGGSKGLAFASAFLSVFFSVEIQEQLFDDVIEFKNNLEQDIKKEIEDTLGLREELEDSKFFEEFKNFAYLPTMILITFLCIVIHQQQLEGMFNQYDYKVHPTISIELQEASLIQASPSNTSLKINNSDLKDIRQELRRQKNIEASNQVSGSEAVKLYLESLLKK